MSRPVGDKLYSEELLQNVLATPLLEDNDARADNVQEYLCALLEDVWRYEEGFDGKRPFGNSGWQDDLYTPLVVAGFTGGMVRYEDGRPEAYNIDTDTADKLIIAAIRYALLGECQE